jgi:hypothetical protein
MKRRSSKHIESNDDDSMQDDWSLDIETVLDKIRINCVILSKEHKTKYLYLKGILRYFRVPVILISSIASVSSVGLQTYLDQQLISAITCLLSLTCGIIGSIELFLAIQSRMENELMASKDYYILSIEIFKVLQLDRENRSIKGKTFLEASYGTYVKLIENSNIIDKKIADSLTNIEKNTKYMNELKINNSIDSSISQSNSDTPSSMENLDDQYVNSPSKNFAQSSYTFFENTFFKKKPVDLTNTILPTSSIDDIIGISNKKNTLNLSNPNVLKSNKSKKNIPTENIAILSPTNNFDIKINDNILDDNIGISSHNLIDLGIEDLYPIKK